MENSIRNLFVIVVLLIAAWGCGKKEASESETDFTKVTNVEVYTVTASSFEDYISLPVVVMPNREVNLGLVIGGKVTRILVDKGDRVKKDMILLETDDTLLRASYDQARASLEYQKKEFARSEKLYSDGSISAAAYDAAELQLASAQSSFDMAKKQYEDAKLKAPFSGVVTMKNVEVGAILGPGTPAFRIIDLSKVRVQAGIPEKYIAEFKLGNTVTISFDALPGMVFSGKINYIAPEASNSVRTFMAEMVVGNSDGYLKAGIMGNARILKKVLENAILVPINAVVESQSGRTVFIAREDNTAENREIVLGQGSTDDMMQIDDGVKPGERIIVKGQQDLVTGERINITGEYTPGRGEGFAQ